MLETLRTLATLAFIGGFAWWLSCHKRELRRIDPRCWVDDAKRMDEHDWGKFVGLACVFALLLFVLVPHAAWFTESTTGVRLVDPEQHPITQVARVSWYLLVGLMVLAVVFEEWLFRGILLERLRRFGRFPAVMLSAFAFGLFHLLNTGTFFYAFIPPTVAGLVLGCAYLAGGLKVSALAHMGYNGVLFLVLA